jgi:hypothetical protein
MVRTAILAVAWLIVRANLEAEGQNVTGRFQGRIDDLPSLKSTYN